MIKEALLHCPQIGPSRLAKLNAKGIHTWHDVIARADELPTGYRVAATEESKRCLAALQANDISYFVDNLTTKDRWRILAHYLDDVSFFDIETAGLEYDDPITVIVCWHQGKVHQFVEHENLDDFLHLLDEVKLLSSFNGSSFDVPRVLDAFHIPKLPCPHLDLRWLCYHQGFRGGLKEVMYGLGIARPTDLQHADGELAIRLWARWEHFQDQAAKDMLLRYCAADVLLLIALAEKLVGRKSRSAEELWANLPGQSDATMASAKMNENPVAGDAFGPGSPLQLRGRRRMVG